MVGFQINDLKFVDAHRADGRLDGNAGIIGQIGRQVGRRQKDLIQLSHFCLEQVIDLCDLVGCHGISLDERIHVKAVSQLAGNTTGRCVGLLQISKLLQLCHLVADCSRRTVQLLILENIFGANGTAALNMRVNDRL